MIPLNHIELSARAQNALAVFGISTFRQLCDAPTNQLICAGLGTARELIAACVRNGFRPQAIKNTLTISGCAPDPKTMVKAAGPYSKSERQMMECAIAQYHQIIPWGVSQEDDGLWVWRDKNGYVELDKPSE